MTETQIVRRTWWNKWKVPAAPVIVGMTILTGASVFGFAQQKWDREETAADLKRQSCLNQREFRGFFTDYLESQIGTPIEEIPGFEQLSPEARQFVLLLAPIIEADRIADEAQLAEFILTFPIPNCRGL